MRDLIQFVRQLWEDRLQSVEEFTKENNLSLEEALKMRNKELEGCMKDLESQTDALLDALEEADSMLASPRRDDEKLHRKLALGECLQRIGKQEAEAELAYDQEKVEFLRQARQLLIDSFQGDSPVLSASSLVDDVTEEATPAEENDVAQEEVFVFPEVPKVSTEEQDVQTDEASREEAGTQTRALIAKKIKALKKKTDEIAPKILGTEKETTKSPKRSPRQPSPKRAKKKLKAKKTDAITPQYINARLKIRAPSPRRHRLPWESATEEDGDDGYTSTDLSPTVPPQPNNSAVSLAEPSDDNMGFETAEETLAEQWTREKKEKAKERKASKSPKREKAAKKSKSPKRREAIADSGTPPQQQQPAAPVSANIVTDMGQGEGGRPRRRRSKSQRSQMTTAGAGAAASSDEEEGERRRRAAEPHGDGGRPALNRRRSPRTAGDGSPSRSERRATTSARGARTKHAHSPPPPSQVYCLTTVPQPLDLNAVAAAAAAAQSDSKRLQVEPELAAKQQAVQPRPTRRKRCSGGGDTMSVQSFNSAEDGRTRSAQEVHSPQPLRPAAQPPGEPGLLGATGGEAAAAPAGFQWEAGHMLYQQDPFSGADTATPAEAHDNWLYRMQPRERGMDMPPADGPTEDAKQQVTGDDSGFQSEATRSPARPMYVPPLNLPLPTTSDGSAATSPQPRPKSDTEIAGLGTPRSPHSPHSPGRGGMCPPTSPGRQLERSFSCEVPAKKQRRSEEPAEAVTPVCRGSGDQPPAVTAPLTPRTSQSPQAAEADTAGHTPQPSPKDHSTSDGSDYIDCVAQSVSATQAAAAVTTPSPASAGAAVTPVSSTGPVSQASNTGLLRRDYEQLRAALAELKELQTSFQRDFAANELAKEASGRLQSDIQRMETSIQALQGIVSQEYEQTRQDHEETRSAIEQIETRIEESEQTTQTQLNDLRVRLDQIADKMTRLEGDVSREKEALTEEKKEGNAPNVLTLSSMLTRLETEVITLRHEVDSNRHSIDSITSVTQLDSPKPSPSSGLHEQSNTSDWQETGRTDATQSSAPIGGGDVSERQQQQQPVAAVAPGAAGQRSSQQQEQRSRPEDLDSFKDSNSDMSSAEEGKAEEHEQPDRSQQLRKQQPAQQQQQPAQQQLPRQQRQRAAQTDMPEQCRPAAVSPLKMVGGRRSVSCCKRHQPEVLRQLRHMHLAPPPARPGKRSRSAAPPGTRDESEYDSPLQDYWAADLSTASASTEAPRVNESTRVHHGSSRNASRHSEERHHKTETFLNKLDSTADPSDKLDQLQHKLLSLRRRVLLSMYRRQRRRAVSEGPRGRNADQQQQRRRAQLAAIDRRLRQRIHGWNRRLLAEAGYQASSSLSPGDVISDSSMNSREFRRSSELASDSGSPAPAPAPASQRTASEYLHQLSHMLANSTEREERKVRGASRGRHRDRTLSPPTKDPSAAERRPSRRQHPATVNSPGVHLERFARNESKLVELQEYLGGIRQHLQRMATELDSPPSAPSAAAVRGSRGLPATQAVVFRPWTRRNRSVSTQRPTVSLRY